MQSRFFHTDGIGVEFAAGFDGDYDGRMKRTLVRMAQLWSYFYDLNDIHIPRLIQRLYGDIVSDPFPLHRDLIAQGVQVERRKYRLETEGDGCCSSQLLSTWQI